MYYELYALGYLFRGKSIDELKDSLYQWQLDNDIGASKWCGGAVYRKSDYGYCTEIGWMSYNGRLWAERR